jgi:toxin ParE1/3/4
LEEVRPMRLRYARRARLDIDGIHDWISRHNPRAAAEVVDRIRKTAELLSQHPGLGRETDIPGIRVLAVPRYPYLVYHSLEGDELVIIHVRDGARAAPEPGEF